MNITYCNVFQIDLNLPEPNDSNRYFSFEKFAKYFTREKIVRIFWWFFCNNLELVLVILILISMKKNFNCSLTRLSQTIKDRPFLGVITGLICVLKSPIWSIKMFVNHRVHYNRVSLYRFPSLFAVDTFRHFGPRILNSQIKSPYLTGKLSFFDLFFPCE